MTFTHPRGPTLPPGLRPVLVVGPDPADRCLTVAEQRT